MHVVLKWDFKRGKYNTSVMLAHTVIILYIIVNIDEWKLQVQWSNVDTAVSFTVINLNSLIFCHVVYS